MPAVLTLLTAVLVICTVLPRWRHPHWLVRSMDFPRLQLAVIAALLLPLQFMFLQFADPVSWMLVMGTIACLTWQLSWVMPYTRVWSPEVAGASNSDAARTISIVTANVLTPNRNAEALIGLVRRHEPDILVTLESDQWWQDQLDTLEQKMPHTIKCPLDNLYGMHVYSRLPLADEEIAWLVEDDVPSMHARVTLRSGDEVRVHFVHPAPPSPVENSESSERDAELVVLARSVADSDQPVIVTGDLNDVAWSSTTRLFRRISGLLDPRVGRGLFNTFHAQYPFLRWPLDHLFHSEHFALNSITRLPDIGSDHFPLLTVLTFTPEKRDQHEALDIAEGDQARARAIVGEQDVSAKDVPVPG